MWCWRPGDSAKSSRRRPGLQASPSLVRCSPSRPPAKQAAPRPAPLLCGHLLPASEGAPRARASCPAAPAGARRGRWAAASAPRAPPPTPTRRACAPTLLIVFGGVCVHKCVREWQSFANTGRRGQSGSGVRCRKAPCQRRPPPTHRVVGRGVKDQQVAAAARAREQPQPQAHADVRVAPHVARAAVEQRADRGQRVGRLADAPQDARRARHRALAQQLQQPRGGGGHAGRQPAARAGEAARRGVCEQQRADRRRARRRERDGLERAQAGLGVQPREVGRQRRLARGGVGGVGGRGRGAEELVRNVQRGGPTPARIKPSPSSFCRRPSCRCPLSRCGHGGRAHVCRVRSIGDRKPPAVGSRRARRRPVGPGHQRAALDRLGPRAVRRDKRRALVVAVDKHRDAGVCVRETLEVWETAGYLQQQQQQQQPAVAGRPLEVAAFEQAPDPQSLHQPRARRSPHEVAADGRRDERRRVHQRQQWLRAQQRHLMHELVALWRCAFRCTFRVRTRVRGENGRCCTCLAPFLLPCRPACRPSCPWRCRPHESL